MTTDLDFSRCRMVPVTQPDGTVVQSGVKDHVKVGVAALIKHPFFALFDEMGGMKSVQVIIAAQMLYERGIINRVIVVAPASVRTGVWFDEELGELKRHLWDDVPQTISEYHKVIRKWRHGPATEREDQRLRWIITNYEFIRPIDYTNKKPIDPKHRLAALFPYCTDKTLLVLDESSAIKSSKAEQTKACRQLRNLCGRVVLLNGTPISNSPGDMFSQGNMMHKSILNCPSYTQFCARYAIMKAVIGPGGKAVTGKGGHAVQTPDKWTGIDDIQRRFAPYVLRRLKIDCLDLPAKLPPVMLNVALTSPLWSMYKQMRDQLVVWLTEVTLSQAPQAMTKIMRLAQLTSGFLGGIEDMDFNDDVVEDSSLEPAPLFLDQFTSGMPDGKRPRVEPVQEVGQEKLNAFMKRLDQHLVEEPGIKIIVRSRFRPELLRLERELSKRGDVAVGLIMGQKRSAREQALRLLDPRTMPKGPVVVGMSSGISRGLNLTGSHTMYTMSNDFSLDHRLQSDDRVHRPGQLHPVSYFELVATGPQGQRTIDHKVLANLMAKHDLATFTTSAWLDLVREEMAA